MNDRCVCSGCLLDRIWSHDRNPRLYANLVGRLVVTAPDAVAAALDRYEVTDGRVPPSPVSSEPTGPSPLPGPVGNFADVPASVEPERGEVAANDGAATPRSAALPPIRWADC